MNSISTSWVEKYRPNTLSDLKGNPGAIQELREWANSWKIGSKPLLLYGSPGVGKTTAALCLCNDYCWDLVEFNASDIRTAKSLEQFARPATESKTFDGSTRLIVFDEVDNLHGNSDRGGAVAIRKIIANSSQPIILTCNDVYGVAKEIRSICHEIQFRKVSQESIFATLININKLEDLNISNDILFKISNNASGDLRSAINDLQSGLFSDDVRDSVSNVFNLMQMVFQTSDSSRLVSAAMSSGETPDTLIQWIDENIPLVRKDPAELLTSFDMLSKSDIFLERAFLRQTYSMWKYASYLMLAGVQSASEIKPNGFIRYQTPSKWRKMGANKKSRIIRDSILNKASSVFHMSTDNLKNYTAFLKDMIIDPKSSVQIAAALNLSIEEIAFLLRSAITTKKVKTLFEESMKMRENDLKTSLNLGQCQNTNSVAEPIQKTTKVPEIVEIPIVTKVQKSLFDF